MKKFKDFLNEMSRKIPDFGEESYTIPYKNFKKAKKDLVFSSILDLSPDNLGKYNIYLAEYETLILFAVKEGSDVPSVYVEFGPINNNGIRMFNVTTMRFSPPNMGNIIKKYYYKIMILLYPITTIQDRGLGCILGS